MVRNYKRQFFYTFIIFLSVLVWAIPPADAVDDVIIDNSNTALTSSSGTWLTSGAPGFYLDNSVYGKWGATFTWYFTPLQGGEYRLDEWHTEWPTREQAAPLSIQHRDGTAIIPIDQREVGSGERWNDVASFNFEAGVTYKITIRAVDGDSTCADAIRFRFIDGAAPLAVIDSITPNPAGLGETIEFIGHGDPASGEIDNYEWVSSLDGFLSNQQSFNISSLSEGLHTISFRVRNTLGFWSAPATENLIVGSGAVEIIIDNQNYALTLATGAWLPSGAPGFYLDNSVYGKWGATFTWYFTPPQDGLYRIDEWHTEWPTREQAAPLSIQHRDGTAIIPIDQREVGSGGHWNPVGSFNFEAGVTYEITIRSVDGDSTCADAVRFVKAGSSIPPTVDFSGTPTSGLEPLTVVFTDASTQGSAAITSWLWSFGDGGTSPDQNPSHTYAAGGPYTVSLQVTDANGLTNTQTKPDFITVDAQVVPPTADFSGTPTSGLEPLTVVFTDASTQGSAAITSWLWSFGDGGTSPDQNPSHTYAAGGPYTVSLQVTDANGLTNTQTKPDFITVDAQVVPPTADFSGAPTSGLEPLTVVFTDASTQGSAVITSWLWSFGDGGTSPDQNPSHTYAAGGPYTVSLQVTDANGLTNTQTKPDYITVDAQVVPPTADFSGTPTSGLEPLTVVFTDASTQGSAAITSRLWSFGDGGTSPDQNPSHTYAAGGPYTVSLQVTDANGLTNTQTKPDFITVTAPGDTAEHIYVAPIFAKTFTGYQIVLQDLGATQVDAKTWRYTNPSTNQEYVIHNLYDNIEGVDIIGVENALKTEDAVVIFQGHANYGIGGGSCSYEEIQAGRCSGIYYVDDPRILNFSSLFFDVSISGIRSHFGYDWDPVFQSGTSAYMPFVHDDPRGVDPPYNYFLGYYAPGDPTFYRLDSPKSLPIERIPDFDGPAWFSSDGSGPDASNPGHWQYFVTRYPLCLEIGGWTTSNAIPGYYNTNYYVLPAGDGSNEVRWISKSPIANNYKVFAWWPSSSSNTTDAVYEVNNQFISKDQSINGGQWNELGDFFFLNLEQINVKLTDNAPNGNVIADAIRVVHSGDLATDVIQANFRANYISVSTGQSVRFYNQSTGEVTGYEWDFGDGTPKSYSSSPLHTYAISGTFSVTLTVSGPAGVHTLVSEDYITVGLPPPPVQAEFSNSSPTGNTETIPAEVTFTDRSSGSIVAWEWDLNGDGLIDSNEEDPVYNYVNPGLYTVTLTVRDAGGNSSTKVKENYVRAVLLDDKIDNRTSQNYHYDSRTILYREDLDVAKEDMKYKRLFYESCQTGRYYMDTFTHGIVFYTTASVAGTAAPLWMKGYLEGKTDYELWQILQAFEAKYDYYNFDLKPSEQNNGWDR